MDGAAESDHSMTWEDFFGSTTDLTPTLIGIYDSLLEPDKPQATSKTQQAIGKTPQARSKAQQATSEPYRPEPSKVHEIDLNTKIRKPEISKLQTSKNARTDPPNIVEGLRNFAHKETKIGKGSTSEISFEGRTIVSPEPSNVAPGEFFSIPTKDPPKITGSVQIPGLSDINKSTLYSLRTKDETCANSDNHGANVSVKSNLSVDTPFLYRRTMKDRKQILDVVGSSLTSFENLSPNVKRMISSASDTTASNPLKHQNKKNSGIRASTRGRSNIPLVGATSKISQSGVDILPSVEIYDQPNSLKSVNKSTSDDPRMEFQVPLKPNFKIDSDAPTTYDVPSNLQAIYDVPNTKKPAFDSLSLPYIDQSIELSITSTDREFNIKLTPTDQIKISERSPQKLNNQTSSIYRNMQIKNDVTKQLPKSGPYPEAIGSTGNLKLCTPPEKETTTLHPPTVDVSRPLSMSSIASSSSTSSSGVQNKGGVNSVAYLASIESLDDHSDADMVSAKGSNNFVNSTGMLNAGVSEKLPQMNRDDHACGERSGLSQLQRVCAEIVETEKVYVEDLRQVVEGYLHVWRDGSTFAEEELAELFNNIEEIYAFNRSLCEQLTTSQLEPTSLARRFVDNTGGFEVYTSYCTGYPRTMARLAALASCPHSTRACRERQAALGHALPLGSYLLKPVQRILKYHLLLQNLVKQCQSRETEYALHEMTGIAQHIDDMKRRHEHAVRVQEIQSLLYGWSGPDLTTYGELCAEGTFRVFGAKAMRHAFLFDKMLLLTKNREDGILAYKSHIMCNNLMLVESIAGAPLSFHVIPWDAPRAQLTLQARSQRHKREWTLLLKRVILENYNAVIPSHARQLVMELGQNKTDDDILAEKSHNLITHSSMRKQLSAPEYLEKRKLERERRKTSDNDRLKKANKKNLTASNAQDCDCAHISAEKGTDYTCENCYIDLCSDCEVELNKDREKAAIDQCNCKGNNDNIDGKCPECDRTLHFIDAGSAEHIERKQSCCKCSDFKSSQESFSKEFSGLNNVRGYHSSDNIVSYTEKNKEDECNIKIIQKTCLKCAKIKENIAITATGSGTIHRRKSRCNELEKFRTDTLRSKSKDDPQRTKLSKISTWRRKSEPGLQENGIANMVIKRTADDKEKSVDVPKGYEKIEFECRNCGSTKVTRKIRVEDRNIDSDQSVGQRPKTESKLNALEVRMYNTKHVPKKISKLKKSRAKGLRLGSDKTAKFYADLLDDSTENILHISESTDSINNVHKSKKEEKDQEHTGVIESSPVRDDVDIDEETYKRLIEKTDSFKKNELEKVKYLNQQKVINEGAEFEIDKPNEPEIRHTEEAIESREDSEKPLEQIISQLLMQNREFQKILKKQQQRNSAQRRHQRLLKSHSNPEAVLAARNREQPKIKPKYVRQTSEKLKLNTDDVKEISRLSPQQEVDGSDDDHIYETLRVEPTVEPCFDDKPQLCPKAISTTKHNTNSRLNTLESDYVYLSFDKIKSSSTIEDDDIYDVPTSNLSSVSGFKDADQERIDYYVPINNQNMSDQTNNDSIYDHILEVCKREVEVANSASGGDYLPMTKDQQNPNTPEIWLSRQKEHFNVSRDRKSGSLPRSFQVVTQDENNLSTFKCKPNGSNKTYLNRDGKVLSTDRPFTIASDKSEISYDDIETYMNEDDVLKFNKQTSNRNSFYDGECLESLSRSTLELEEEIDRCYKNNFEDDKNSNLISNSQHIDISATSSCEVLTPEKHLDNSHEINLVHPEHKIYKPTTNLLSLKNVLSRFKNKSPNRSMENDAQELNANEQSTTESSPKIDLKSPLSSEKRTSLNPRSYSKNLLQRFKSIIGDEYDDNPTKPHLSRRINEEINQNPLVTSDIKVIITSTDASSTNSTITSQNTDLLTKSVCVNSTLTESQNEKNNLDALSNSCDNVKQKQSHFRPFYDKSISMITSIPTSMSSHSSPSKSNNSSYHSLNKMPSYKQGSKHLGARIAQSDYVDPQTLFQGDSKTEVSNVNVLINKNALRPDSLFSTSSFVTSSSEGAYQIDQQSKSAIERYPVKEEVQSPENHKYGRGSADLTVMTHSDESFYEKSFEKIENIVDEDLFRDSAVYSDQEDSDFMKLDEYTKNYKAPTRNSRLETIKRNTSLKSEAVLKKIENIRKTETMTNIQTSSIVTISTKKEKKKSLVVKSKMDGSDIKPKSAPPVAAKPKLLPSSKFERCTLQSQHVKPQLQKEISSSGESINAKSVKWNPSKSFTRSDSVISSNSVTISESAKSEYLMRSDSLKPSTVNLGLSVKESTFLPSQSDSLSRSESIKSTKSIKTELHSHKDESSSKLIKPPTTSDVAKSRIPANSIQIKRLSFERTSLDSATRRSKSVVSEPNRRTSADVQRNISKSVLERRLEIESMTKPTSDIESHNQITKPKQIVKPKQISSKMMTYDRSVGEPTHQEIKEIKKQKDNSNVPKPESSITSAFKDDSANQGNASEQIHENQDTKKSWVKTIVNKFQ